MFSGSILMPGFSFSNAATSSSGVAFGSSKWYHQWIVTGFCAYDRASGVAASVAAAPESSVCVVSWWFLPASSLIVPDYELRFTFQNELRVFAARSRRGSSVGRTRGCSGSVRRYGKFAQGGPYRGRCWWLSKGHLRGTTAASWREAVFSGWLMASFELIFGCQIALMATDLHGVGSHATTRPEAGPDVDVVITAPWPAAARACG